MNFGTPWTALLAALALLFLVACDDPEKEAEAHFENGQELVSQGDMQRAILEFRNVVELNESHLEGRRALAAALRERGDKSGSAGQYLRLVEQYPEDLDGQVNLTRLAVELGDWELARRHSIAAQGLAPEDPSVQALATALEYQTAVEDQDAPARRAVAARAETLRETNGAERVLSDIIIDNAIRDGAFSTALAELDTAIAQNPDSLDLHMGRLRILNDLGDLAAMQAQLEDMVVRFPDDDTSKTLLVQFYTSQQDFEKAEEFLRSLFSPTDENPADYVGFVRYIQQTQGSDAALEELEVAIRTSPVPSVFEALKASLLFERGEVDEPVATMERLIADETDAVRGESYRITLARMLESQGNQVGARRLIEEVLASNPSSIEGVKMSARWLIEDDKADEAIVALRTALENDPQDSQIILLIADAHVRNGNRELARDMMALAVDASNNAPSETLRFANVLIGDGDLRPAEDLIVKALRLAPNNLDLLSVLGRIYIEEQDWPRAEQVEASLRATDDPAYQAAANGLQVSIIQGRQGAEGVVSFLEGIVEENADNLGATVAIIQTHLSSGNTAAALATIDEALQANPDNPSLRFLQAAARASSGDPESAVAQITELTEEFPQQERLWLELMRLQTAVGQPDAARETLTRALVALPDSANLLWAQASVLEQDGDIDGAIAVYERLYEASSQSTIVANNLASLLSTYRSDAESLERAYLVARRLRGLEVPAFQDTFGWIAYLRGDYDLALEHLEPGAAGLPDDPLVQYHLGQAYAAVGRRDDAIRQIESALELAGDDPRPQFEAARQTLADLRSQPVKE